MCSETSSPRLSFSSDLGPQLEEQSESDHHQNDTSLLDMNCEFEFSFTTGLLSSPSQESTSADELFSHGIIIPTQQRDQSRSNSSKSLPPLQPKKEIISESEIENNNTINNKPQSKFFWGTFKRSNSLNCEKKRSGLFSSLPLLSRSNSTGSSVPLNQKRNSSSSSSSSSSQKQPLSSMARSNSYPVNQKPPLKKGYGGNYSNGVRIIPVINVPPPYISKGTAKFFGLGSFLHHGKKTNK